jgi:hypothetical protein
VARGQQVSFHKEDLSDTIPQAEPIPHAIWKQMRGKESKRYGAIAPLEIRNYLIGRLEAELEAFAGISIAGFRHKVRHKIQGLFNCCGSLWTLEAKR